MADDRKDISIDGNVATWDMRQEGDISGTYAGTFKFRCFLTPLQKIAANREMRDILGPQMTMATEHEANLAFALTQLKHRVISAPPFWKTGAALDGDIADYQVIMSILDTAIAAELKYLDRLKESKLDSIQRAKAAAEQMLSAKDDKDEEAEDESED